MPEESTEAGAGLSDAIHDALAEYIGTGMVTAFQLTAEWVDEDGSELWGFAIREGQSHARTLGLIRWADKLADYDADNYLGRVEED